MDSSIKVNNNQTLNRIDTINKLKNILNYLENKSYTIDNETLDKLYSRAKTLDNLIRRDIKSKQQ